MILSPKLPSSLSPSACLSLLSPMPAVIVAGAAVVFPPRQFNERPMDLPDGVRPAAARLAVGPGGLRAGPR